MQKSQVLPVTEDFHPVLQQLIAYMAFCLLASDTSAPVHTAPSVRKLLSRLSV